VSVKFILHYRVHMSGEYLLKQGV